MRSATDVARKWAQRTSGASADYKAGVQAVQTAPGARAAASADLWQAKLNSADTKEKYRRKVGAVSLAEWQQAAANKGADRLASGAQNAAPKVEAFMGKLLSYQQAGLGQIDGMPKLTTEDGVARASAWIRYMSKFKG